MFTVERARKFLDDAGIFFPVFEEGDNLQTINQNDTWFWASAFGQEVTDEELPEVADLFWRYGWCGILYWVSKKNDGLVSEFYDVNRFVEFVKKEEELRNSTPSSSERAYKKLHYEIGVK